MQEICFLEEVNNSVHHIIFVSSAWLCKPVLANGGVCPKYNPLHFDVARFTPILSPSNSSLGMVCFFRGVTPVRAEIKVTSTFIHEPVIGDCGLRFHRTVRKDMKLEVVGDFLLSSVTPGESQFIQ